MQHYGQGTTTANPYEQRIKQLLLAHRNLAFAVADAYKHSNNSITVMERCKAVAQTFREELFQAQRVLGHLGQASLRFAAYASTESINQSKQPEFHHTYCLFFRSQKAYCNGSQIFSLVSKKNLLSYAMLFFMISLLGSETLRWKKTNMCSTQYIPDSSHHHLTRLSYCLPYNVSMEMLFNSQNNCL